MKTFEQFRQKRRQVYEGLFSARALCIAGLLMMPALLFNPNVLFRIGQFLFFWFLAWLSGKKNNPLITLCIIVGIIAFNLVIPYGQVLYAVGVFKITSGALAAGIQRAVTLEGLIMLSRFSVRQDLRIPGKFGELVGESFRLFAQILDRKHTISRKNIIADIDRLMGELSGDAAGAAALAEAPPSPAFAARTKPGGFMALIAVTILSWLPWVFMLL
jgi:heptaprenyl diphosphate synthase